MSADWKNDTPDAKPGPPETVPAQNALEPAAADASQPTPSPAFTAPQTATKGEKVYRWLNYTGVGYFANLALSLVIWDFFLSGKGRPVMDGAGKGFTGLFKATGMEAKKAAEWGTTAAKMSASPLGGHVTMIPLKIGEDHQRYITHKFNQALDPNYAYKDLQADWNTPEEELPHLTKEATKQSWGQVALRRGMAWAAVTAAGTGLGKKNSDALEGWTLGKVDKGIKAIGSQGLQNFAETNQTFQRYTKLAALDTYFTVITSLVAYMTNTMFGKARDGKRPDILSDDVLLPSNLDEALTPPPLGALLEDTPTAKRASSHAERIGATRAAEPVKRQPIEKHDKFTDIVAADKANSANPPTLAV